MREKDNNNPHIFTCVISCSLVFYFYKIVPCVQTINIIPFVGSGSSCGWWPWRLSNATDKNRFILWFSVSIVFPL